MKSNFLLAILLILLTAACNTTIEIGLEHNTPAASPSSSITLNAVPSGTPIPTASPGPQPSATLQEPTNTLVIPTNPPFPTYTPTSMNILIYLIAIDDNGQGGDLIGCGDSAIPVQVTIPYSQGVLKSALATLLSVKSQYYGESGLYNALYQSDLEVENVNLKNGKASVNLTGSLVMGGECDSPRLQAQLEKTVLQFPTVEEADIYLNGKPLADVLSLK
jgi:hypothetical protein